MKRADVSNFGVQANHVTAEVMSVGERSRATKVVQSSSGDDQLVGVIAQLRDSLSQLALQQPAKEALAEDVSKLDETAKSGEPNPQTVGSTLSNIVGKLKMVGVAASDVVAIAEPIKKIVTMFGIPLPW